MDPVSATVRIQVAQPSQYKAIADLTEQVYVQGGYSDADYVPVLRDVAGRAQSATVLVAMAGTEAVGAVTVATRGGPLAEQAVPGEAVLRMLAVGAQARGSGAGAALLAAAVSAARAQGCTVLRLSTQPSMSAAHRLYDRAGFVRTADRDWSPRPGLDLLCYALLL